MKKTPTTKKPSQKPDTPTATVGEIAEALGISVRRVNQLADEGTLPREARGVYHLEACLRAYVRFLQKALQGRSTLDADGEARSLQAERTGLVKAQREREELELRKALGQTMTVADHEAVVSDMALEVKARVMAIGPRVAPQLVGQESRLQVQAILERAHKEALADIAARVPRMPDEKAKAEAEPVKEEPKKKAAKAGKA